MTQGGIMPAILGTCYLTLGAMITALPLGVATAIYLSEYAREGRFIRLIRVGINCLAGVPSVVFGLFGLGFLLFFCNLDPRYFPVRSPWACSFCLPLSAPQKRL